MYSSRISEKFFFNFSSKYIPIKANPRFEYAQAEEQISALTSEAESEGYKVIGTTTIRETINSKKDQAEMQKLMTAAQTKKIDAVFVFSSKHISEDYDVSGAFMDALNKCDVVVYDNEGYEYSYDWYFHNVCRSNRFEEKRGNGNVQ